MRFHFNKLVRHAMGRLIVLNDMHGNKIMREGLLDDLNVLNRDINKVFNLWLDTNDSELTSTPSAKS